MGVGNRLKRLEKEAQDFYSILRLPDGTEVRYTGEEMLDAMIAAIHQGEHWLLPHVRRMDIREGMPGLIRALEGSRERVQGGEDGA